MNCAAAAALSDVFLVLHEIKAWLIQCSQTVLWGPCLFKPKDVLRISMSKGLLYVNAEI